MRLLLVVLFGLGGCVVPVAEPGVDEPLAAHPLALESEGTVSCTVQNGVFDCGNLGQRAAFFETTGASAKIGALRVPWNTRAIVARSQDGKKDVSVIEWGTGGIKDTVYVGKGQTTLATKATQNVVLDAEESVLFRNRGTTLGYFGYHGGKTGLLLNRGRIQFTNVFDGNSYLYHEVSLTPQGKSMILLPQAGRAIRGSATAGGSLILLGGPANSSTDAATPGDVRITGGNRGWMVEGNILINVPSLPPDGIDTTYYPPQPAQGMKGGVFVANCSAPPAAPPANGSGIFLYPIDGELWVTDKGGAFKIRDYEARIAANEARLEALEARLAALEAKSQH